MIPGPPENPSRTPDLMKTLALAASLAASVLAAPGLKAQKDTIELRNGKVLRNVAVESWTAKEIKWKGKDGAKSLPAHEVKEASLSKVQMVFARLGNDPGTFYEEAKSEKDPLISAACYHNAAMLYFQDGKDSEMLTALQELDEKHPQSPYTPEYYRWKIRYYLGRQKPSYKDAMSIAQKYGDAARTRSWSRAYEYDAEYWEKMVEAASGKTDADGWVKDLKDIIGKTESSAPFVADVARADMGDALRGQKKYAEAKEVYQQLEARSGVSANVRARMFRGLGYIAMEQALTSNNKEDMHEALKNFLKIFLNCKDGADPELVAEGLYQAAKACEQWNELPSCKLMAARLRGRLKLRSPWKETSWAEKR